jgi:hypothetical protein
MIPLSYVIVWLVTFYIFAIDLYLKMTRTKYHLAKSKPIQGQKKTSKKIEI